MKKTMKKNKKTTSKRLTTTSSGLKKFFAVYHPATIVSSSVARHIKAQSVAAANAKTALCAADSLESNPKRQNVWVLTEKEMWDLIFKLHNAVEPGLKA